MTIGASSLDPFIYGVAGNVQALLPIALSFLAIFVSIRIIPALIKRFVFVKV